VQFLEIVVTFVPFDCGRARSCTAQLSPPGRVEVEQLSLKISKSVSLLSTTEPQPVAAAPPEFWSVKVCGPEVWPTVTSLKECVSGVQASETFEPLAMIWFCVVVTAPPTEQDRERVVALSPLDWGFALI
jgi:hypothetical protein